MNKSEQHILTQESWARRETLPIGKLGIPMFRVSEGPPLEPDYQFRLFWNFTRFARESELGSQVTERLRTDPRCISLSGQMINNGSGGGVFQLDKLVAWWLWRANETGSQQADKELDRYLDSESIEIFETLWVYSVEPSERLMLADGVELVPLREMPDSDEKEIALRRIWRRDRFPSPSPSAALMKRCQIKKIGCSPSDQVLDAQKRLHQTAMLLNCLPNVSCVPGFGTAYFPSDAPMGPFDHGDRAYTLNDVVPFAGTRLASGQEELVVKLVEGYGRIPDNVKPRMERALLRFAQAKGRLQDDDMALDFGIALEMLLLNSLHKNQELPGQLSLHFRLRGAWLLGENFEDRKRLFHVFRSIYTRRSQVAHNGFLGDSDPAIRSRTMLEHMSVGERLFQKLILQGIPDPDHWSKIVLGLEEGASNGEAAGG